MGRSDTWMPFYVADYLRDTMHLTAEEHGAYLLLIMACWTGGGSVRGDLATIAGITKLSKFRVKNFHKTLADFFDISGDIWTHKRVVIELTKARKLSEIRSETGSLGGRPRRNPETKPKPNAKQNETPSPSPLQSYQDRTPSEDKGSSSGGRPKRISEAWAPSEKDRQFAMDQKFTPTEIEHHAAKFKNYWMAASGRSATKTDWAATWRNWILTERERKPAIQTNGLPPGARIVGGQVDLDWV